MLARSRFLSRSSVSNFFSYSPSLFQRLPLRLSISLSILTIGLFSHARIEPKQDARGRENRHWIIDWTSRIDRKKSDEEVSCPIESNNKHNQFHTQVNAILVSKTVTRSSSVHPNTVMWRLRFVILLIRQTSSQRTMFLRSEKCLSFSFFLLRVKKRKGELWVDYQSTEILFRE